MDFTYLNFEKTVFEDATIKANLSEIIALVGPYGEGKSTMVRLILRLTNPKGGQAVI
ncbi:MAG: ATP-binding cassette domain-containing protein [Terrisporobacter sp.]